MEGLGAEPAWLVPGPQRGGLKVQVKLNGKPREVSDGARLGELLDELGLDRRFLVVEHNGEPLARDRVDQLVLSEADSLELVRPVAGG